MMMIETVMVIIVVILRMSTGYMINDNSNISNIYDMIQSDIKLSNNAKDNSNHHDFNKSDTKDE